VGFVGCSWLILLSGSDLGPFVVYKYGLTVIDLKDVGPEGNWTLHVSLSRVNSV